MPLRYVSNSVLYLICLYNAFPVYKATKPWNYIRDCNLSTKTTYIWWNMEEKEVCVARHRKEKKELQGTVYYDV